VILVVFVALAAAVVPLSRGRLTRLAGLRFRHAWLIPTSIGLQVLITVVWRSGSPIVHQALHILSYVAAVAFLYLNRRIPGMWLISVGAAMNVIVILANGGVMPASPHALAMAGLPIATAGWENSASVAAPHLAFLGDIFAIPKSLPLSNVFSVGDVCIALGAAVTIHRVSGSRLIPSGRGQFAPLFRERTFMRLWTSQAISNIGDWTYGLAVATTLAHRTHDPKLFAFLLIAQVAPAALFGGVLGALPDRYSRLKLMIGADVIRALAVGSLLIGSLTIGHIYVVAAILGVCGALFQPSLQASIPNVVDKDHVVAANAMVGATYHFAIMAGPALGGLLVSQFGATPVFAMNMLSFVVSAGLIAGMRLPPLQRIHPVRERTAMSDLVEGAKYSMSTPLVRGLLVVIGIVLVAAASKAPLESLFVLGTLALGPKALGLILGCWGLGMLLGSVAAPAISRKWARERLLATAIFVVGLSVLLAAQAHDLETVLLAWLIAGCANSIANISYESLLQERTPDHLRGRVFSAFEVVTNIGFLTGAFAAGWLGSHVGVRLSYVFSGALFLLAAVVCKVMLPAKGIRKIAAEGSVSLEPVAAHARAAEPALAATNGEVPAELRRALVATIVGALADPASRVRRRAAMELGRLQLPDAIAPLGGLLHDEDDGVRAAAVDALASIPEDAVVSPLVEALEDPYDVVRDRAANELARRDTTEAISALQEALASRALRPTVLSVLARMDRLRFVEELSSDDPVIRHRSLEILVALGGHAATDALVRALTDPVPGLRVRAVELLAAMSDPDAHHLLELAASDPVEEVAFAARRQLAVLGPADQDSVLASR
jgi:MFS family permease